jgi:hypothetical protein
MRLLADIEARFRVPAGAGRATDPDWTERRLVPLAPRTLKRLEAITEGMKARSGVSVEPMQLAALLLDKTGVEMVDAPAIVGQHEEHEKHVESGSEHGNDVDRGDLRNVIAEEGPPLWKGGDTQLQRALQCVGAPSRFIENLPARHVVDFWNC